MFLKAYEIFKKEIIPLNLIINLKNGNEKKIEELLSKSILFKEYKSKKDIIINAKAQAMKKVLKFSIYAPLLIYVPSFGKAHNVHRIFLAMTTSIAKVYARNLSKEEAVQLVENNLAFKKEEIEKHGTNTKFNSFVKILLLIDAIFLYPIAILCVLCTIIFGSFLGKRVYNYGKKINEELSKDFEKSIPIYLYNQSMSFNYGICSLKAIYDQNKNNKSSAPPPIKKY